MSFSPVNLTMDFTETYKLITYNFTIIFFFNFFTQSLINCFIKFQRSPTYIPPSFFIASILTSFCHNHIPLPIMTKIHQNFMAGNFYKYAERLLVGVLGIEPSLHEPESCVLPVYDTQLLITI